MLKTSLPQNHSDSIVRPGTGKPAGCRKKGSLLEKVEASIVHFSVKPGEKIVVAVSGGPDSVSLLHLLRSCFPACPLSLHVAHLNHGLRPEASEEASFVENLCKSWGLRYTSARRPVLQFCRENGFSIQAGARSVRYGFLSQVARERGARWIALGHTADDQAETFLMRALRGSGLDGLSGIPERRDESIIRPLLGCTRKGIIQYLSREKIPYLEDASNNKRIYRRNQIRHALIPVLEQYNPKVKEALTRGTALLQEENDFIHQSMVSILPSLRIEKNTNSLALDIVKFRGLHPALQRRVLRWGIEKLLGREKGVGFQAIETIRLEILPESSKKTLTLPHFLKVEKRGLKLCIERRQKARQISEKWVQKDEKVLPEMDPSLSHTVIDLPDWEMKLKVSFERGSSTPFSTCIASFDFDKLSFPLSIRGWQPGDRFVPLGMRGHHKKIQDFFVDAKIAKYKRHRQAILTCSKGIMWLVGLRIDERFRTTKETVRTMKIEIE